MARCCQRAVAIRFNLPLLVRVFVNPHAVEPVRLTGPPALINTLAVSLGFGVLRLSQVPANARLGFLLVVGLVNCFIVSLLLLPVLLPGGR
jgi:predicted RND superfamily exporter protein